MLASGCSATGFGSSGKLPLDCDGRDVLRYRKATIAAMQDDEVQDTLAHNEKVKALGCAGK